MNKKNTVINVSAALITFFVQIFISFWLSPFLIDQLGEEAYGFVNLANNFVSYASLVTVAVNSMSCRYISVEYNSNKIENAKKYFCSVFFVNIILYAFIFIISVIFISKLEFIINITPKLIAQVKLTFLLSFVNMGTSMVGTVYTAAAFSKNKMHFTSIIQVISNVLKTILIYLLFTFLPVKVYFLSLATLMAGIWTLIGNYKITKKLFKDFNISIELFDCNKVITLVKSGFWVLISNISNLLLNGFDLLLSNLFISNVVMGRLSLAKQIPYAISSGLGIFANIFSSSLTMVYASKSNLNLVTEAKMQLRILTMFFTVPFAGIIVFGIDFLKLWLSNLSYSISDINEIYLLMIIMLIDIIVSTYMYSIHSLFIAIDKVKQYSVVLFFSSIMSIIITLILLNYTQLGVFAIAGTSTIILGISHAVIVPAMISKLLNIPIYTFWVSEIKSWITLFCIIILFIFLKNFTNMSSWSNFFVNIVWIAVFGYIISCLFILNKKEKTSILKRIKLKIE